MLEENLKNTIMNIKKEIMETQISIMSDANKRLINLYFKLVKIII